MDALDNVIFATLQSPMEDGTFISSDYVSNNVLAAFAPGNVTPGGISNPIFGFSVPDKVTYSSYEDTTIIERGIVRHWYDLSGHGNAGSLAANRQYRWPVLGVLADFQNSSTYHLIFAYLIENTRMLQIFERVIERYLIDEDLGIAPPDVYQWIQNSEKLFFRDEGSYNIRSLIRPIYDANRRNAYHRLFGIDLAFGDINSSSSGTIAYHKAKTSNQQFIPLFEKYLTEIWNGYINARNSVGPNTTDANHLTELATQLRELLHARRGDRPGGPNLYSSRNLSSEEYAAVVLTSWFTFVISANTPLVNFLNCQSSSIGERLLKIGAKVGVPAHTKCQSLFEMAGAASNILTLLETGTYLEASGNLMTMLSSLNPGTAISINSDFMNSFLTVIHNWEKATGHRIKTGDASIVGSIAVQPSAPRPKPVLN